MAFLVKWLPGKGMIDVPTLPPPRPLQDFSSLPVSCNSAAKVVLLQLKRAASSMLSLPWCVSQHADAWGLLAPFATRALQDLKAASNTNKPGGPCIGVGTK